MGQTLACDGDEVTGINRSVEGAPTAGLEDAEGGGIAWLPSSARVLNPRATPGLKQELVDEVKRQRRVGHRMGEQVRYGERSTAERVNAGLKDNHGGRTVRVRGPDEVFCHLMFGILSLTVLQLVRLVT